MNNIRKHILFAILSLGFLPACTEDLTQLQRIKHDKTLRVVTRNSPTTFYNGPFGPTGLEYDLAELFADHLGVELSITSHNSLSEIIDSVRKDKADIAAAGLTISEHRKKLIRFGPSYQAIKQVLVYRTRTDQKRPRNIKDIIGSDIEILANSYHAEILTELKKSHPGLTWHETSEQESSELLELVWSQFIDYTIADSNELILNQKLFPELSAAFDVGAPGKLAWGFRHDIDDSLYNEAIKFFQNIESDGRLKQLLNKYYGHAEKLTYVGTQTYIRDVTNKLPKFRAHFVRAAKEFDLDWRLLAAIGYQESHWRPDAVSPTGVRGIMMLTQDTAQFVGIEDRQDVRQSIIGGAKYFRFILDRVPERIKEPDRVWLAMAAYNIGRGHLEDARILTERQGGDPDKWVDVRERLPLLSKKKWYSTTKYGYARGHEPVIYVTNIRNYYDLLVLHLEKETMQSENTPPAPPALNVPAL